jgi:hypothetical protein
MVLRNPGPTWLVHLVRLEPTADLRRDGVQLTVDPVPLVVSVCSHIHLRRGNRLLAAMALAHGYSSAFS